jgi:hypothetical protein
MRRGILLSGALALFAFSLLIAAFALTTAQTDLGSAAMAGYAVEAARYPSDLANYSCNANLAQGAAAKNYFNLATGTSRYSVQGNETNATLTLGQLSVIVDYEKNHPPAVAWDEGVWDSIDSPDAHDVSWESCDADEDGLKYSILYNTTTCSSQLDRCDWMVIDANHYRFSSNTKSETIDLTLACGGDPCTSSFRIDAWDGEFNGSGYAFDVSWKS